MSDTLHNLCAVLGVTFRDTSLLRTAITHSSLASSMVSYERLEFVGDRVLGLAMAELLYRQFPSDSEGALARRHAQLVRSETLAAIARSLGFGNFIRMAPGEESTGGRDKDSLLSDALEAIVAAIYFDQGLDTAKCFVERHWKPYFNEPLLIPKDFKTALQETVQAQGYAPPVYEIIKADGPAHAPNFTVRAQVDRLGTAAGVGPSKRKAEQAAAQNFFTTFKDKL
ncbi:MAG: ribonuclease III [Alphaproteobacteria bacterium]|nr:MAG: ribonuclease III [Alphaproteobacteria bacterium]